MSGPWDGIASPDDSQAIATSSLWDGAASPIDPVIAAKPQSFWDKAANFVPHQMGLLSDAAIKGATALPTMIANIPAATANATRSAGDWAASKLSDIPITPSSPSIGYANPFGEGADTILGPNAQPTNGVERLEGGVAQALSGAGSGINIGKDAIQQGSQFIGPKIAKFMSMRPDLQLEGAAGGAAAGELAQEGGYGPKTQIAASLAGAMLAPSAATGARAVNAAVQPLYEGGKNQIAANFMRGAASDPDVAIQGLNSAPQYIPQSMPTSGVASGDYGLMDAERTLRQSAGNPFGQRIAEQNGARNATMNALAGTPGDIAQAQARRAAATGPLYESAQNSPVAPNAFKPVLSDISDAVTNAGQGSDLGKTLLALQAKIKGALPSMEPVDTGLLDESGSPITRPNFDSTTQGPLTQIYREERDQLEKSGMQPGAYGSSVKGVVKPINYQLGKILEAQSPDLAAANQEFSARSADINKMQNMQDLTKSLTNTAQDAGGNYFYSPAKVAQAMKSGGMQTENQGWQSFDKALDPNQQHYLENLHSDLARDNMLNSPAVRPTGSNTFANFTGSGDINSKIGSLLEKIPVAGNIYKGASADIKNKLIAAMLDPKLAAKLIAQGKQPVDPSLMQRLAVPTGAALTYGGQ